MSYILEAILKADLERQRSCGPDVLSIHAWPPPASRHRNPWPIRAAAAATLVNLAVLAAVLAPWPDRTESATSATTSSPPASVQPAPPLADAIAQATVPPAPPVEPAFLPVQRHPGHEAPASERKASLLPFAARGSQRPFSSTHGTEHIARQMRAEAKAMMESNPPTKAESGDKHVAIMNPAKIERSVVPEGHTDPKRAAVPHLRDLPPQLGKRLPHLRLSLHLYAPEPGMRKIRIGDRTLTEGEMVDGELAVDRITRDGVVFRIQDQLFFLGALESWRGRDGS